MRVGLALWAVAAPLAAVGEIFGLDGLAVPPPGTLLALFETTLDAPAAHGMGRRRNTAQLSNFSVAGLAPGAGGSRLPSGVAVGGGVAVALLPSVGPWPASTAWCGDGKLGLSTDVLAMGAAFVQAAAGPSSTFLTSRGVWTVAATNCGGNTTEQGLVFVGGSVVISEESVGYLPDHGRSIPSVYVISFVFLAVATALWTWALRRAQPLSAHAWDVLSSITWLAAVCMLCALVCAAAFVRRDRTGAECVFVWCLSAVVQVCQCVRTFLAMAHAPACDADDDARAAGRCGHWVEHAVFCCTGAGLVAAFMQFGASPWRNGGGAMRGRSLSGLSAFGVLAFSATVAWAHRSLSEAAKAGAAAGDNLAELRRNFRRTQAVAGVFALAAGASAAALCSASTWGPFVGTAAGQASSVCAVAALMVIWHPRRGGFHGLPSDPSDLAPPSPAAIGKANGSKEEAQPSSEEA